MMGRVSRSRHLGRDKGRDRPRREVRMCRIRYGICRVGMGRVEDDGAPVETAVAGHGLYKQCLSGGRAAMSV